MSLFTVVVLGRCAGLGGLSTLASIYIPQSCWAGSQLNRGNLEMAFESQSSFVNKSTWWATAPGRTWQPPPLHVWCKTFSRAFAKFYELQKVAGRFTTSARPASYTPHCWKRASLFREVSTVEIAGILGVLGCLRPCTKI